MVVVLKYRVFIKYCVFSKILRYILDSALSRFPLGVSECTQLQVNTSTAPAEQSAEKSQHFNEHSVQACKSWFLDA